jgi:type I restriction enzyme, S subunit
MKAGWQLKRFEEVLEIRNGKNQREVESESGEYPIFGSAGNVMGYATSYICEAGTTIIGRKGNINTPIFATTKFWNVDTAFGLASKPELDSKFLYYFCVSFDFGALNRGTTIPSLVKSELLGLQIPMPKLPEQKRIVTLLDEAFAHIATAKANAEQNLQNARALFESHLQSVFTKNGSGWHRVTLGEATGGVFTGPFGSLLHKSDYIENGIPLVNPAHITANGIEPDLRKTVSVETAQRLASYIMRKGDIVIARRGEMGRCALITDAEDGWLCGTGSFCIKPSARVDPAYLVRFLRSNTCKQRLEKIAGGAVMPNLSNTDLSNLNFDLPSVDIQRTICAAIDELATETQRLESLYQQKLSALESLKKSLLHQAFSGQL